jgi:exodeoxyribonuclease V gamma subunit
VVHSRGLERWLSQRLSQRLGATSREGGICANVAFPFPAAFLSQTLDGLLDESPPPVDPWSPDALAWTLLDLLPRCLPRPEFEPLRRYLRWHDESHDGPVDRRTYGLARHLADLFDRYVTYRPSWALAWSHNREPEEGGAQSPAEAWQRALFHEASQAIDRPTLAHRMVRTRELIRTSGPAAALPQRVSFFGVTALPPVYLEYLMELARLIDVHLFVLCPSDQYWADIRSRREIARTLKFQARDQVTAQALHLDEGQPLLASLGRMARDFQVVLEGRAADIEETGSALAQGSGLFVDPLKESRSEPTMLAVVQSDILNLRHRRPSAATPRGDASPQLALPFDAPPPAPPRTVKADDRSVQVHACHGPTRQVEVLREVLLDLLNRHPELEPRDILVMSPDLETFAPLVAAVFAEGEEWPQPGASPAERWGATGTPRLPMAIADRTVRRHNPVADALARIVDLASSRLTASAVADLLALDVVAGRFSITAEEQGQLRTWIRESGIRWAIDDEHRAAHDQPPDGANTWRFGLDRLLLGLTMESQGRLFADVLAYDGIEGDAVELLGRFTEFCEHLFDQLHRLQQPRPLAAWVEQLTDTLTALTATTNQGAWLSQQVRDTLATLGDDGGSCDRPLSLDAITAVIGRRFDLDVGSVGLQTGAMTFCAMRPMRSVPHQVICLLGMEEGGFPRRDQSLGFDLMATEPRLGDRSVRDEDRMLLLEAILAARRYLVITYSGRDPQSNEPRPPAVPLGELLEVVDAAFVTPDGQPARNLVEQEHPLHPFSPRCYGTEQGGTVNFHRGFLHGARQLVTAPVAAHPFFDQPLQAPEEPTATQDVDMQQASPDSLLLSDLIRFFEHPTRYLLQRQLGLYLAEENAELPNREPTTLDGLAKWSIGSTLLAAHLGGVDEARAVTLTRASGQLPLGTMGDVQVQEVQATARSIAQRALPYLDPNGLDEGQSETIDVELPLEGQVLQGRVRQVHGAARVALQFGAIKAKHLVTLWINHLALTLAEPDRPRDSWLFGARAGAPFRSQVHLVPLGKTAEERQRQASQHLSTLVTLFHEGQQSPLLFFPNSSWAFFAALDGREENRRAALAAARTTWLPRPGPGGERCESNDAYYRQALGEALPFDAQLSGDGPSATFEHIAHQVWTPLVRAWAQEQGDSGTKGRSRR